MELRVLCVIFVLVEIKARVDAVWEQMNKGMSSKTLNDLLKKPSSTVNKTSKKSSAVRNFLFLFRFLC